MKKDREQQEEKLASEIMKYVRDSVAAQHPYLNRALFRMPVKFRNDTRGVAALKKENTFGLATEGTQIILPAAWAVETFARDETRVFRTYLHMLFHCLYLHPFQYSMLDLPAWDLASDAAVESRLFSNGLAAQWPLESDEAEKALLADLASAAGDDDLQAERIYHELVRKPEEAKRFYDQSALLRRDLHYLWLSEDKNVRIRYTNRAGMQSENMEPGKQWNEVRSKVAMLQDAAKSRHGKGSGGAHFSLRNLYPDDRMYRDLLVRFAKMTEEVHVNMDEFDYIYYTYGMSLYGNIPLIEPLEYRETLKIRDFVIAIDTSGSCQGSVVRGFLHRTYSIIRNSDIFTQRMNLHILQCDCAVLQDRKITSLEELDDYCRDIQIQGAGGTDFRPVFDYVEELKRKGEFTDLRGLLYFTDGIGTFPENAPSFQTGFVFLKGKQEIPEIPSWAVKVVLNRDTVEQDDPGQKRQEENTL
ncbi:MAG: VWA-like domain-containing protein [Lachnospiraceae bacterium]|jgi:hypothetical protein|nr:VWA-like domain-containing protein [Lachnospiraceae bacterium]MCH4030291.1 VWA-like domain-containing protein [Lachnospiraceae bacterium]MCH4069503.1 VWA-like domain-containing protein [Lachnospiraceae bacterium]MCH4107561.1 VWA-like domain-containing protein [Lachnospiraceae bacterium]MCI1301588.1 VWA-like domain-containing protein [Lachnospiraceae bacterium]